MTNEEVAQTAADSARHVHAPHGGTGVAEKALAEVCTWKSIPKAL